MTHEIAQHGFAFVAGVLNAGERDELLASLGPICGAGRRGILALPAVSALARSTRLLDLVRSYLPSNPLPVRTIYFDKSPEANWFVSWHQDLTLAVRDRVEVPGFGPWSTKDGIPHVHPPVELLENMLAIRLHLDDTDESNGALRVLPGSHRFGRLSAERIRRLRSDHPEFVCTAASGDALLD